MLTSIMKKASVICLISIIVFTISFIIYFSRQIFSFHYDPAYYDNYYYHSQWNIPNSTRGISDGELYKFIGFRLASGENPFNINYEVPPFAKLLYGLAEKYFGNPYLISLTFYLLSIVVFYFFSKKSLLITLLFITTPFLATQIRETMLDLPLTFFFLVQCYFFTSFLSHQKIKYLILSGIFLGLATGTKTGVYTPFLIIICFLFLTLNKFDIKQKIKNIFIYSFSTFSGYCLAYISYFVQHPNPIPWLRLHQKQLDFYLKPQSVVDHFAQLKEIFLHKFTIENIGDWSPILIVGSILLIPLLVFFIKTKRHQYLYLVLFCLVILLVNCFIPFFPRYLMPIIPIYILLISFTFKKHPSIIVLLIFTNFIFLYQSMVIDKVEGHTNAVARFISTRNYPELYRSLNFNENISEDKFSTTLEYFYNQISTKQIEVNISDIKQNYQNASAIFDIKYQTNYGSINHKILFTFQKINNQWKTNWNWDYLWPNYSPQNTIYITNQKNVQSIDVFIIPQDMHNWSDVLSQIEKITVQTTSTLDQTIKTSIPDKYPRYIGTLKKNNYQINYQKNALSIPGVSLKPSYQSAQIYFVKDNQKIFLFD